MAFWENRYFLGALSVFEAFITSGVIFGWPSLVLLLILEGNYSEYCLDVTPHGSTSEGSIEAPAAGACNAQLERFNLIFTIATSVHSGGFLPFGAALDYLGPRAIVCITSGLVSAGYFLLAFSNSRTFDAFLAGAVLLCVGGPALYLSMFHVSNLFPHHRSLYTSLLPSAAQASTAMFLIVQIAAVYGGIPRAVAFSGFALLTLLFCVSAYVWPVRPFALPPPEETVECGLSTKCEETPLLSSPAEEGGGGAKYSALACDGVAAHEKRAISDLSFMEQARLPEFYVGLSFIVLIVFKMNFFVGTVNEQILLLVREGQSAVEVSEFYVTLYSIAFPLGGFFGPLVGRLIDRYGYFAPSMAICTLGVVYNVLLMIPSLELQIATFVLFSLYRAFVWAAIMSWIAQTFGMQTFGRVYGVFAFIAALGNLLCYPFVLLIHSRAFGIDFFAANIFLLVISFATFSFPLFLLYRRRTSYALF